MIIAYQVMLPGFSLTIVKEGLFSWKYRFLDPRSFKAYPESYKTPCHLKQLFIKPNNNFSLNFLSIYLSYLSMVTKFYSVHSKHGQVKVQNGNNNAKIGTNNRKHWYKGLFSLRRLLRPLLSYDLSASIAAHRFALFEVSLFSQERLSLGPPGPVNWAASVHRGALHVGQMETQSLLLFGFYPVWKVWWYVSIIQFSQLCGARR